MISRFLLRRTFATGYEHSSTTLKRRTIKKIYPPPGDNLVIPEDWNVQKFLDRIGMGCVEHADKFEEVSLQDFMQYKHVSQQIIL